MPIDPNIILGVKPVELQNPMDVAVKGLTMRQLSGQVQAQDQSLADDQAVRQALSQNTSVDASGNPTVNRAGVLMSATGKGIGIKSLSDLNTSLQSMDKAQKTQLAQQTVNYVDMLKENPSLYPQIRPKLVALSIDPKAADASLPPTYDAQTAQLLDTAKQHAMLHAQDMKDQMEFGYKQQELGIKKQDANANTSKAASMAKNAATNEKSRGSKEYDRTLDKFTGSRVPPEIKMAQVDAFNADKAEAMLKDFPDLNKMDDNMVHTYLGEVGKIAIGGQPTIDTLRGLDPNTLPEKAARAWQKLTNSPSGSNLKDFLTEMRNYANRVGDNAHAKMYKYGNDVLKLQSKFLAPEDVENFRTSYVDPHKPRSATHPLDNLSDAELAALYNKAKAGK